jgi:dihydrofolate reductase
MSLDGYIADEHGSVDWLNEFQGRGEDYGYAEFYRTVDTVLMGRTTYEQTLTFEEWGFEGKKCFVFSRRGMARDARVEFTDQNVTEFMEGLKRAPGSDIWLVGGAKLIDSFLQSHLIDVFIITVIPRLLGKGIRLFGYEYPQGKLILDRIREIGDVVQLEYRSTRER